MLIKIARNIWRVLPYRARLFVIRSWQHKFTVSVVALVTDPEGRVLVLDHYLRPGSSWGLPGGFIDPDEPAEEAVKRELIEETGLEITNVQLIEVRTIRQHIEVLFRAEAEGEPVLKSNEIRDAGWFEADSLPQDMYDHQRETIRQQLKRN